MQMSCLLVRSFVHQNTGKSWEWRSEVKQKCTIAKKKRDVFVFVIVNGEKIKSLGIPR